ncbi:hypothetical protein QBA75_06510 [Streptomyces stelliscabiei]
MGPVQGAALARSSADAVTADGPSTTTAVAQATVQGLRRVEDQDLRRSRDASFFVRLRASSPPLPHLRSA